jgi:hypothetical protein
MKPSEKIKNRATEILQSRIDKEIEEIPKNISEEEKEKIKTEKSFIIANPALNLKALVEAILERLDEMEKNGK